MIAEILFWVVAAGLAGLALGVVARPLWSLRQAAPPTAAHDVAVYKAQLKEIERDLARGALTETEAEGGRREISRRLLAADAELAREDAFAPAPERSAKQALTVSVGLALALALATYLIIGDPARPGVPFAERDLQAERSAALLSQEQAEARAARAGPRPRPPINADNAALIARMREALDKRPDDPEGRILLGRALLGLQRPEEAWPLFAKAASLMAPSAPEQLYAQLGEAMMLAADGYVSREAEVAFSRAQSAPISRYMLGVADGQRGDYQSALQRWTSLYLVSRDASFAPDLLRQIRGAAQALELDADALVARLRPPNAAPEPEIGAPGPTEEQIAEAARQSPEQVRERIEGMVSGLAERLADDPEDIDGWLRLIRSYGVMGRREEAAAALETARATFVDDAAALERLERIAQATGLTEPDAR